MFREDRDRGIDSGNEGMAGVEGLLALPLFVVTGTWTSPFASLSFTILSFRPPTDGAAASGSAWSASSGNCSFDMEADSFIDVLTSGMFRPVARAATSSFGVEVPFGLFDATDGGLFSCTDCVEFCRARPAGLPPFVGGGEGLGGLISGNVVRTGEEAIDGDIAELTVLFL